MPKTVAIFQTLSDRGNYDQVERDGPFPCRWENAWLGHGYYFWESFPQNAHWWGKAHLQGSYIICEASCVLSETNLFDLAGDTTHMLQFSDAIDLMKKQGLIKKRTTVSRVLHFMRKKIKVLKCDAIRAYSATSISNKMYPDHIYRLLFEQRLEHTIDYKPPFQICIFDQGKMFLKDFRIIFPEEYSNNYIV